MKHIKKNKHKCFSKNHKNKLCCFVELPSLSAHFAKKFYKVLGPNGIKNGESSI